MILQALTNHYETLAAKGEIPRDGWADVKVSWALELSADGELVSVMPLTTEEERGGKTVKVPRIMTVPAPFKRTVGIRANFLCDNAAYILGVSDPADEKDKQRFAEARKYHLSILESCESPAAHTVRAFFERWDPAGTAEHPVAGTMWKELVSGGRNITFYTNGQFVVEDADIARAWQDAYQQDEKGTPAVCLVTGKHSVPAPIHPAVKGVKGAQSSGAALVSFNADSFVSFGKEQNLNAPVSKYAAFAYTTALNHLLADMKHKKFIGDATMVYWAENAEATEQDIFSAFIDGGDERITDEVLDDTMKRCASGQSMSVEEWTISPSDRFFILALSPNNARVSVRFFHDTTFGDLAENFGRFYEETSVIGAREHIPLWILLSETARRTPDGKAEPSPQLAGDMLRAILTGCMYPETFYQRILLRIRAERDIRPVKAAAIKAFLLRNRKNHPDYPMYKEVLGVKLNEETVYLPYVLGELFAVLEAVQESASGVTTIKDRYFTSACTTPQQVFPRLIELANHHLRKMEERSKIYWSKEIGALMAKIGESFPAQMNLNDQGVFQIGYYHRKQKRYEKNQQTETKEDAEK